MAAAGSVLISFGVVYTITREIAVLTPPLGLNLYVIRGIGRGKVGSAMSSWAACLSSPRWCC